MTDNNRLDSGGLAIERVAAVVEAAGVAGRQLREVVYAVGTEEHTLASLVRSTAVPRRTVEEVLSALGDDLEYQGETFRLRGERVESYAARFDFPQLRSTVLTDPLAARMAQYADTIRIVRDLIERAPASRQDIDHVSATAETVVRRALWMDSTFDLAGSRILFVGDHDLTSIATALVCPRASITVVDLDERILEFIDTETAHLPNEVQCLFADLRLGLPTAAARSADLAVTDPPYTPEGIKLFLARGLAGLRDKENSRILMAYGFSARQPALGLKVQNTVRDLHLATEAMLPRFNRYLGAQAVGSSADWYVCRPTSRTWRSLESAQGGVAANIYTHGPQSLEGGTGQLDGEFVKYLLEQTTGEAPVLVGDGWGGSAEGRAKVGLDTLLANGIPAAHSRRGLCTVVANLAKDPGGWLLRVLLAANCREVVAVVPDSHPDVRDARSLQRLSSLVSAKYALRIVRDTPRAGYLIVRAEAVDAAGPDDAVVGFLLSRAHGKVGNVWRDGLIRHASDETELTKRQARDLVQTTASKSKLLGLPLIELARHDVATVVADARASMHALAHG
ncbi:bis-aminopropyl spermidine synthase family protein [Nocardia sp. NPDC019255]|uniref:bis-aminopropyl spermidine synthase family protein n=1 Tax=Nocardia sp. NPDC019255 TaxID=3154591 RepID=UPI0033EFCAB2